MAINLAGYFSRFDTAKNFERHLWRAGKVLQGAELNEAIEAEQNRLKQIADVFLKDGAVIRDAGITVDPVTGVTQLEGGAIYLRGAVRGVAAATITIPVVGKVLVGIYLQDSVITELEDPSLRDPAVGVRNTNEPGAARLKTVGVWGREGDGTTGEFYPVYVVIDGVPVPNNPPPNIDAIALAIAAYDRQSAGGYYASSGCMVSMLADLQTGEQVYSISEGIARVDGREVTLTHARRVVYAPVPDLKQVLSEPHVAVGGSERVNLNHSPVSSISQVLINAQKTVSVQHGGFSGAQDALPDTPILSLVAINQGGTWNGSSFTGGTNYTANTDFKLTNDRVDWSPTGAEPAPGSTYTVVYRYLASVTPTGVDATGFTISGAVAGTVTQITYQWKRPRIDRLCLATDGTPTWVVGVPSDYTPIPPPVSPGLLPLASVLQTWTAARSLLNDGVRLVAMNQLQGMQFQIDNLFNVVSDQQLRVETAISDPTTKKGIFTDPFNDDSKRDQGIAQTAAVYDNILTLPMSGVQVFTASLTKSATLPLDTANTRPIISQTLRTTCVKVNPYDAFQPIPAGCVLVPSTDFWTDTVTTWTSPVTRRFETRNSVVDRVSSLGYLTRYLNTTTQVLVSTGTEVVSTKVVNAEFLRQIVINFTLTGFGPGEILDTVLFDGRSVAFLAP